MAVINAYPYLIGTALNLDNNDCGTLIRLFEKPAVDINDILGGRASVVKTQLNTIGPVVIKYYRRGGMIRHLIRDTFLRSGKTRARRKFEMYETVRALGISCPEPLIWASRGSLFYKAYLVTREITQSRTLADICLEDESRCSDAVQKTADQIVLLIKNRIHHVDLHPGNVLIDGENQIYIIDFDKACVSPMKPNKLAAAYLKRWKKAVFKYQFPDFMNDIMEKIILSQCP